MSASTLLFLDIDGVMNTTGSCLRHRSGEVFEPGAIKALRWLVERTEAGVVVTSTRRRAGLDAMRALFARNGMAYVADRVTALTPILTPHDTDEYREEEVAQWLEANLRMNRPLVIIDDKPFKGPLARFQIQTDADHGLTWELARLATAKLVRCERSE